MKAFYDVIIIGSGFGGSVTACRLSQNGYSIAVLERGRRWKPEEYPRQPGDDWIWDQTNPAKRNGWLDLRIFPSMVVAQGAAVGGGSLIYANVQLEAKPDLFESGWPPEITYDKLKPYYDTTSQMLNVQRIPKNQWTDRTQLMHDGAHAIGHGNRFGELDLAVSFDPDWNRDLPEPYDVKHSKKFTNAFGREQGTCVHLGHCDIGCDVQAKNTLDLNYLALAEQNGAEVYPLHIARRITPQDDKYRVDFERIEDGDLHPDSVEGRIVILAAGSLGSTDMLLRCKEQYKTLPNISMRLGVNWSSNGDFATPAIHRDRDVAPTRGITISSTIDFMDGAEYGQHFNIQDGGFPSILRNWFDKASRTKSLKPRSVALRGTINRLLNEDHFLDHVMLWFAQGRDAANGRFRLRRRWLGMLGPKELHLDWDIKKSEEAINAIAEMHKRLAEATNGYPMVPPTWTLAKWLVTPHPLGGCNMGHDANHGVVDHKGEVFGHKNLYVADGSIIPEAIGANPSKTIAALAERIAGEIIEERR